MSHILFKKSKIEKKKKPAKSKNMKTCDLGKLKASRWTINSKELVQAKVGNNKSNQKRSSNPQNSPPELIKVLKTTKRCKKK